jgi:hypothetical protein
MRFVPATRRMRWILTAVAVVLVVFVVATVRLFIVPTTNAPEKSGAIVILGGSGGTVVRAGVSLAEEGYAPLLVISLRPDEACIPSLLELTVSVKVRCFHANPQTTQGEARAIAHLAAVDHLHRIIVVAPTAQVTRARLRVGRCYSGQILMEGVRSGSALTWPYDIAYEWAALAKAEVLQRGC